jgi:hypothetical protein
MVNINLNVFYLTLILYEHDIYLVILACRACRSRIVRAHHFTCLPCAILCNVARHHMSFVCVVRLAARHSRAVSTLSYALFACDVCARY